MLTYLSVLTTYLKTLAHDEEGASAVEYGLILGLVAVAIVLVLGTLGTDLNSLFTSASNALPASAPAPAN
jgi:pilus assembly protein Flp/PilA